MFKTLWQSIAAREAELLIRELGFSALPISPIDIAKELDIEVKPLPPRSEPGISGMLLRHDKSFGILYSTAIDSLGFQHFSVGHEIGHYRLPGHPESVLRDGMHASRAGFHAKDRYELEADHFSTGLLMPASLFDRALNKAGVGLDAIEKLSSKCVTSLPATAIRYAQRSPEATAIVVSSGEHVEYCFMSDRLRELRGLEWLTKGSLLPLGSVTRQLNGDPAKVISCERADSDGDLRDWFGGTVEADLYEEAIGLGRYGKTLSVLSITDLPDDEELEEEEELIESWTPRFRR
jgi:hypothetical protein